MSDQRHQLLDVINDDMISDRDELDDELIPHFADQMNDPAASATDRAKARDLYERCMRLRAAIQRHLDAE